MRKILFTLLILLCTLSSQSYSSGIPSGMKNQTKEQSTVATFDLAKIKRMQQQYAEQTDKNAYEFFKSPNMSLFFFHLNAGQKDNRPESQPQDEVYLIVKGKAKIRMDGQIYPVHDGSIIYVANGVRHRILDVAQPLDVVVFFTAKNASAS